MWQRRVIIVALTLVTISVLFLAVSIIYEQVIVPRQAVSSVNGEDISTRDFEERVRFVRWQTAEGIRDLYYLTGGNIETIQQYAGQQLSQLRTPALMGDQVLTQMEEELLLKQEAERLGIRVDDAAVNARVDEFMSQIAGVSLPPDQSPTPSTVPSETPTPLVSPTPTSTRTPTPTSTLAPTATPVEGEPTNTPAPTATATVEPTATLTPVPTATLEAGQIRATLDSAAKTFYEDAAEVPEVDREVVREAFYYEALRQAVYEAIAKDVPTEELQVDARHMLFAFNPDNPQDPAPPGQEAKDAAKARADAAMQALQDGEPFATLAETVSDDTTSAARGGELGWASPDTYVGAFADTVTNAALGEIVGPIESEYGYHIIQVLGREIRPLTESQLSSSKSEAFNTWLDERKAEAQIGPRRSDWFERVPEVPTYNDLLGDILAIN
ncbi:MAG: peptidylprolyl isomerase [Anaerolineae bacterium]|nr:peptidylprolyl isomerase [Anaerolineae bacterium]